MDREAVRSFARIGDDPGEAGAGPELALEVKAEVEFEPEAEAEAESELERKLKLMLDSEPELNLVLDSAPELEQALEPGSDNVTMADFGHLAPRIVRVVSVVMDRKRPNMVRVVGESTRLAC